MAQLTLCYDIGVKFIYFLMRVCVCVYTHTLFHSLRWAEKIVANERKPGWI